MKSAFLLEAYREPRSPCGDTLGLFVVPVFVVALTAASAATTTTGTTASSGTGRADRLSESVVAAARGAATFAVVLSRSTWRSRGTEVAWRTATKVARGTAAKVARRTATEIARRTAAEVAWRTAEVTALENNCENERAKFARALYFKRLAALGRMEAAAKLRG